MDDVLVRHTQKGKILLPWPGWGILQLQSELLQRASWQLHHTPSNALLFCQNKPTAGAGNQSPLEDHITKKGVRCQFCRKAKIIWHKLDDKQTSKSSIQDANGDGHQGPALVANVCSTEMSVCVISVTRLSRDAEFNKMNHTTYLQQLLTSS